MKKLKKIKKQLTIMGSVWDFWPILNLFDRNYESRYISFYEPWLKGNIKKEKIILYEEKTISVLFWPIKIIIRTVKIISEIKKFEPQLIISHHDDANISVLPTVLISKLLKIFNSSKFIFWIRNNPIETYKEGLWSKIVLFSYKYIYRFSDMIMVQNKKNKEILEKNFPSLKNKIQIFPNVYDIENLKKLSKDKLEKNHATFFKENFVFLNIGRLTEQKAQWYLIRAFKRVSELNPKSRLVIISHGELEFKLKQLVNNLKLNNKVLFLGWQKNPYKFIAKSSCLAFTSLWEGMPNIIIESLALNIPIISTDCESGPREILSKNLPLDMEIKYPYFSDYGILIHPFKREFVFKTLKDEPLSRYELELVDIMNKMVIDKKLQMKYSNGIIRANEYDIKESFKYLNRLNNI